jgi:hypothetical protein
VVRDLKFGSPAAALCKRFRQCATAPAVTAAGSQLAHTPGLWRVGIPLPKVHCLSSSSLCLQGNSRCSPSFLASDSRPAGVLRAWAHGTACHLLLRPSCGVVNCVWPCWVLSARLPALPRCIVCCCLPLVSGRASWRCFWRCVCLNRRQGHQSGEYQRSSGMRDSRVSKRRCVVG